jgi:hypothetical protein
MRKRRLKLQKRGEQDIKCHCYDGRRCWKEIIEVE